MIKIKITAKIFYLLSFGCILLKFCKCQVEQFRAYTDNEIKF